MSDDGAAFSARATLLDRLVDATEGTLLALSTQSRLTNTDRRLVEEQLINILLAARDTVIMS